MAPLTVPNMITQDRTQQKKGNHQPHASLLIHLTEPKARSINSLFSQGSTESFVCGQPLAMRWPPLWLQFRTGVRLYEVIRDALPANKRTPRVCNSYVHNEKHMLPPSQQEVWRMTLDQLCVQSSLFLDRLSHSLHCHTSVESKHADIYNLLPCPIPFRKCSYLCTIVRCRFPFFSYVRQQQQLFPPNVTITVGGKTHLPG